MSDVICEQQRRRSACASAQSDQCLCCSLSRSCNVSSFCNQNFKPRASFCSLASLSLSWAETPEDTFSHDEAQIYCFTNHEIGAIGIILKHQKKT